MLLYRHCQCCHAILVLLSWRVIYILTIITAMCCSAPVFSQIYSSADEIFFFTVHYFRRPSIRSILHLPHRTTPPQSIHTVHFLPSAPHTSSVAFLCGACSHFRTTHIIHNLSVRCISQLPHRTIPSYIIHTVPLFSSAPYTSGEISSYSIEKAFRSRNASASGIAKQLSTIPRAAHPCGAFLYHRKALSSYYINIPILYLFYRYRVCC